ncbi:interleukin-9 receptor-like isoform X1 [Embiotoca jacksoni]|uniref:interleukin-9 receptor-like isoform X1 n=1 Tax=Embiotoca jacksoni TaxID=100190 RepID=UPI003704A0F0
MKSLLFLLGCSNILSRTSCIASTTPAVKKSLCVSDFWYNITCVLNISDYPVEPTSATYSLKFTHNQENSRLVSCPLALKHRSYSCDCEVKNSPDIFHSPDHYNIKLCDESDCHLVEKEFFPAGNIKLSPPPELEVQTTTETLNITFKTAYEEHPYLKTYLNYEVLLQASDNSVSKIWFFPSLKRSLRRSVSIVRGSELKSNSEFCIKARFMAEGYGGNWSEWSELKCWKNEGQESVSEEENPLVTLAGSLVPVCALVGVLLFLLYSPAARMKIKTLSYTPSPAPFFQPLFQQHKGNLQDWLSPRGQFMLTYKTEEILTTDAVTVVPKPVPTHPEENPLLQNPPVTQLDFPQCQSSYVGLPGMLQAPPPVTQACPGDAPYTQLPTSIWGFHVVAAPPADVLETSRADSGCEDLTPSPECSLPNTPVDITPAPLPPPCYHTDYCILSKTEEGVVPVLVSRES